MTCGACVSTIEGALSRAQGVVRAKVALLSERAEVLFDSQVGREEGREGRGGQLRPSGVGVWRVVVVGQMVKAEALRDLIEAIGYDAQLLKVGHTACPPALPLALHRQTDRQTDRQADRQTDRQTDA